MVGSFAGPAEVVAADRDEPGLAETCASTRGHGAGGNRRRQHQEGAARIVGSACGHFGTLSICVNNAAVAPHTSLLDETVQVWDTVYAVNCRGTFLMTQLAGRR